MQLALTAWLYPAMHHATRESKYQNKLIEPRQQHEDDFGYILRIQKLYNINIWVYTPRGGGKVELFKQVDGFDKDKKGNNYNYPENLSSICYIFAPDHCRWHEKV